MKRLGTVPGGRTAEKISTLAHPERTTMKNVGDWDVAFQEWTNRPAIARAIRMQEKRERRSDDYRAVIPLQTTEGY